VQIGAGDLPALARCRHGPQIDAEFPRELAHGCYPPDVCLVPRALV
jgi:hypothetical protein